jgi:hypothetical protein
MQDSTERPNRRSLSDGFLACLVIVGPTFLLEELWNGAPLIDRGNLDWVLPATVMAIGFFAGGTIAGRHHHTDLEAFNQGVVVASLTIALIFITDVIRRLVIGQGFISLILLYWVGALVTASLVAGIGGLSGRRRSIRTEKSGSAN